MVFLSKIIDHNKKNLKKNLGIKRLDIEAVLILLRFFTISSLSLTENPWCNKSQQNRLKAIIKSKILKVFVKYFFRGRMPKVNFPVCIS